MLAIDEALTAFLLSKTALTALIGQRLYPDETPPSVDLRTQTAVVYQTISDIKTQYLSGAQRLERPRYQWTAYAPSRAAAHAIAQEIKAALSDFSGHMGDVPVQAAILLNELPSILSTADIKVYAWSLEFEINYERRSD